MDNNKRKKYSKNNELTLRNILIRCGLFTLLFFVLSILTVLLVSYFLYKTKDPTAYTQIGGLASLFFVAFLTGFIQSRVNKGYYFIASLILGLMIFFITLVISLILPNNSFNLTSFIWRLLIPVLCVFGGAIGIKRKNVKSKYYR